MSRALQTFYVGSGIALVVPAVAAVVLAVGIAESPWEDGLRWFLYMITAAAVAAILGLVFGVPRARTDFNAGATERYSSNSNLEQISDWLTKLLVGAGLVQLNKVPHLLSRAGAFFGDGMTVPNAQAFATSAVLYGSGTGFAIGYLWTRLRLRLLLEISDNASADASRPVILSGLQNANASSDDPAPNVELEAAADRAIELAKRSSPRPILWVDDFPDNNVGLVRALRALQVRVDLATSTKDALTQLDTTEFGLVISDLGRREDGTENDMAGRDLTTQIRQKGITTPVFIYAGRRALAHRQELEAAGATLVTDNPARLLERAMGAITSLGR